MIRLIITEDHAIVRHGLRQILAFAPDIKVVGEASDGDELRKVLEQTPCNIVLLDMKMPGLSGVELITLLRREHPGLPVLVLSMHAEGQIASRAIKAGASGYLTKDSEPEILLDAIRKVFNGGRCIDSRLVESLVFDQDGKNNTPHRELSKREFQVFMMLASGKLVVEIANELCLSIKTISTHKVRLMRKMNLKTITDLIRYAIQHDLIKD